MERDQSQAVAELWNMIFGFIKPTTLKCAVDLGILDEICNHGRPMSLSQLHSAVSLPNSRKPHLGRLMRTLTHYGFIYEQAAGGSVDSVAMYDLTSTSRLLTNPDEGSLNLLPFISFQLKVIEDVMLKAYLCMGDSFRQEDKQMPFEMAHNCSFWEMASHDSNLNDMFNNTMVSTCSIFTDVITDRGGDIFKGVELVVDVGGGTGTLAKAIATNYPHVKCTVLDLPHVVQDLPNDGIVKFVPGDMFNYIPPADAVLLKWILHCWSDEKCIEILKQCKEAISRSAGGKVIIIEAVVGCTSGNVSEEPQLLFDMLMLTSTTGAERDEQEWKSLFTTAGFSSYEIVQTIGFFSIIEVHP